MTGKVDLIYYARQGYPDLYVPLGVRLKLLNPNYCVKLPKDLNKSFLTKCTNKLRVFAQEHAKDGGSHKLYVNGEYVKGTIEDWIQTACSDKPQYLYSSALLEINKTYIKYSTQQSMDEAVVELLKMAKICAVMEF
jgi:hypothetical protein